MMKTHHSYFTLMLAALNLGEVDICFRPGIERGREEKEKGRYTTKREIFTLAVFTLAMDKENYVEMGVYFYSPLDVCIITVGFIIQTAHRDMSFMWCI